MENRHFLVQMAPEASWPPDVSAESLVAAVAAVPAAVAVAVAAVARLFHFFHGPEHKGCCFVSEVLILLGRSAQNDPE